MITFDTEPECYRHWRLSCAGAVATLTLDVAEEAGFSPGYRLKLNSYDLGVDIEFYDALNRVRFEHPEVRVVVLTSGKERVFCSGANIYMLGQASHSEKVNFCKFTNETRNGIEDSSENSGQRFITVVNGTAAGGGYELALATDHIIMADDGAAAVALPEVPLLAVLPGILLTVTGFARILIVLGFLRTAMGTPSIPPNQVLVGIAFFLFRAERKEEPAAIAATLRTVVVADYVFTATAAIAQPLTGLGLVHLGAHG